LLKVLVRWKVWALGRLLLLLLILNIRILLAFVASKGFELYKIDVKSAFQNDVIQEEVFVR
jgi:hypothetical protein